MKTLFAKIFAATFLLSILWLGFGITVYAKVAPVGPATCNDGGNDCGEVDGYGTAASSCTLVGKGNFGDIICDTNDSNTTFYTSEEEVDFQKSETYLPQTITSDLPYYSYSQLYPYSDATLNFSVGEGGQAEPSSDYNLSDILSYNGCTCDPTNEESAPGCDGSGFQQLSTTASPGQGADLRVEKVCKPTQDMSSNYSSETMTSGTASLEVQDGTTTCNTSAAYAWEVGNGYLDSSNLGRDYYPDPNISGQCDSDGTALNSAVASITVSPSVGSNSSVTATSSAAPESSQVSFTSPTSYKVSYAGTVVPSGCTATYPSSYTTPYISVSGTYTQTVTCPFPLTYTPSKNIFAKIKSWITGETVYAANYSVTATMVVNEVAPSVCPAQPAITGTQGYNSGDGSDTGPYAGSGHFLVVYGNNFGASPSTSGVGSQSNYSQQIGDQGDQIDISLAGASAGTYTVSVSNGNSACTPATASVNVTNWSPACGTANKTYPSSSTSYGSDTFCAGGSSSSPSSPSFPSVGGTTSWTCGTNSCSAGRLPTASLLVNGGTSVITTPGQTLNFSWTSSGGTSWSSTVTRSAGSPAPWTDANTASGSSPENVTDDEAGYTYYYTYTVTGPGGTTSATTVQVSVNSNTSSCSNNTDCSNGQVCTSGSCGACTYTYQCGGNLVCTAGACTIACSTNADCGTSCNDSYGTCYLGGTTSSYCGEPATNVGTYASWSCDGTTPVCSGGNSCGSTSCTGSESCSGGGGGSPAAPGSLSLSSGTGSGGGSGGSCQSITASWPTVSGATSYNLYRNTSNTSVGATKIASVTTPYVDSGLSAGSYYYWVTSVNSSGESAQEPASANSTGGTAAIACGVGNLSSSDKDIVSINGNAISPTPSQCNGTTDPLPSGTTVNVGDVLGFQINLCNSGTGATTNETITDNMINLVAPTAGFNVRYNGALLSQGSGVNQYQVSGSAPNQSITVNLSTTSIGPSGGGHLTYEAQTAVPGSFSGNIARFQNGFSISYNNGTSQLVAPGNTPLLPFYNTSGSPTINEVP